MSAPDPKKIFRPESLERLSNPEQLDNLMTIVTPKGWIALGTILLLIASVILWAFFGYIPIKIEGKGIVMNQKGLLFNVQARVAGIVKKINVKAGDEVKEGDLIALMNDPEEDLKLEKARIRVSGLEHDLDRLKEEVSTEEKANREAQESEMKSKEFRAEQLEKRLTSLQKDIDERKRLYNQGLISHASLADAEEKFTNNRIELESTRSAITNIKYNLAKGYRTQEVKEKEHQLFLATQDRDLLETRLPYYKIYSPSNGVVLSLLVSEGDLVSQAAPLIWMEFKTDENSPYVIYSFFPVEKGKRISAGTTMQISLSTVESQEFGYMKGTVIEVSEFAVSKDSIAKSFHNKELVEHLTSGSTAVIQALVKPEIDIETQNYVWTSGKVPPVTITTGTVCTLQAIINRVRPIYYIIPLEFFHFAWSCNYRIKIDE